MNSTRERRRSRDPLLNKIKLCRASLWARVYYHQTSGLDYLPLQPRNGHPTFYHDRLAGRVWKVAFGESDYRFAYVFGIAPARL